MKSSKYTRFGTLIFGFFLAKVGSSWGGNALYTLNHRGSSSCASIFPLYNPSTLKNI